MDNAACKRLPTAFRNTVVKYTEVGSGFVATVRTNASMAEELAQWLQQFGDNTNTRWRVRQTYPAIVEMNSSQSPSSFVAVMNVTTKIMILTVQLLKSYSRRLDRPHRR